jgi:hypothetical protein
LGEPLANGLVKLQRPPRDVIAGPTDEGVGHARSRPGPVDCLAMLGRDVGSPAAFQNGMDGDDVALIENADHVG